MSIIYSILYANCNLLQHKYLRYSSKITLSLLFFQVNYLSLYSVWYQWHPSCYFFAQSEGLDCRWLLLQIQNVIKLLKNGLKINLEFG